MTENKTIRILLRAYPADWRREYGDELAAVLEAAPITLSTIRDVLRNGIVQRIRGAEVWQTGGIALAAWLILGTALNSIRPFPAWAYNLFWQLDLCIALIIGYLSASRDRKSYLAAAVSTGRAALIGISPELLLGRLWAAGLVHPTILQSDGTPIVIGHGITDLCMRAGVAVPPSHVLIAALVWTIQGAIAGALGASASQFVSAFREGLRPSKN
jgi:hypothetical protein